MTAGGSCSRDQVRSSGGRGVGQYRDVPREIVVLDDIPKTASGKVLRRELRDLTAR